MGLDIVVRNNKWHKKVICLPGNLRLEHQKGGKTVPSRHRLASQNAELVVRDLHKISLNEVDGSSGFHVKVREINNYVEMVMYSWVGLGLGGQGLCVCCKGL